MLEKSDTIFIAGHRGLLGSAFVRRLTSDGFRNLALKTHGELDLTSPTAVDDFFSRTKPAVVLLCAAKVGGILANAAAPADFIRENLLIQTNVMNAAQRVEVKHFVFFGSSCMYPRECKQPMAESDLLSGRPEPTSIAYAMAKLAGLTMCLSYNTQFQSKRFLPVIPNNAYGPGDNFNVATSHVLSALIARFHEAKSKGTPLVTLWGSGKPRREFVHADDIVDACLFLLSKDTVGQLPINIGPGVDHTIRELAEIIAEVVGFKGEIAFDSSKPDGAPRKLLDSSRILAMGWRPSVSLEEGILATYRWYQESL